jgi:hypothetical protein
MASAKAPSSLKAVLGGKRKAAELSPEPVEPSPLVTSPIPLLFDTRPLKKTSSSSILSHSDSPIGSTSFSTSASRPPSSFTSSIFSETNPVVRLELSRVSQQLNASREDLVRERQGRDHDRLLFEQEIAWLKAENERLVAEKEKRHE